MAFGSVSRPRVLRCTFGLRCTSHLLGVRAAVRSSMASKAASSLFFDTVCSERIVWKRRWVMTVTCCR